MRFPRTPARSNASEISRQAFDVHQTDLTAPAPVGFAAGPQATFFTPASPAQAPVAEPGSVVLLLSGLALVLAGKKRTAVAAFRKL